MQPKVSSILALATLALLVVFVPCESYAQPPIEINEIRINQPEKDDDEYFELIGPPNFPLTPYTYIVIGDGGGGASGVIEEIIPLNGQAINPEGFFVAAEPTFTLGVPDLVTKLIFENSDNVTHMLVENFTGALGQDLDINDDCVLDSGPPWAVVVDVIGVILEPNPPVSTECHYGPPTVGPDGAFAPGHVHRCPDSTGDFVIAAFELEVDDTPGAANLCPRPCFFDPALCDDGDPCTDDFCAPEDPEADKHGCAHTPSTGASCNTDDDLCTLETCVGGSCLPMGDVSCPAPCPPCEGACDPLTGLCPCVLSVQTGNWTDPATWDIPGFPKGYPDNLSSVPVGAAIINGNTVTLDADVDIDALCVIFGGELDVTSQDRGNLSVGPDGAFVRGLLPDVFSTVRVAFDRQISVPDGAVIFAANSVYKRLLGAEGTTASLNAGTLILVEEAGDILEGPQLVGAAHMELDQSMCVNASQELRLMSVGDIKDNCEPIDLRTTDEAEIQVGDGTGRETASFNILVDTADIEYDSAQPLQLCGDFVNRSTTTDEFDWAEGAIEFTCPDPLGGDPFGGSPFTIEAAGKNVGPQIIGLCNNYALGTLTVGTGVSLLVVDLFDNQQDGLGVVEAVYANHLVVLNGATLAAAGGAQLFYKTLVNEGTIPGLGVDVIEADQECPDLNGDGVVGAFDLAMLLGSWGPCVAGQSCCADLNGDGAVDAFDLAMLLGGWGSCL